MWSSVFGSIEKWWEECQIFYQIFYGSQWSERNISGVSASRTQPVGGNWLKQSGNSSNLRVTPVTWELPHVRSRSRAHQPTNSPRSASHNFFFLGRHQLGCFINFDWLVEVQPNTRPAVWFSDLKKGGGGWQQILFDTLSLTHEEPSTSSQAFNTCKPPVIAPY